MIRSLVYSAVRMAATLALLAPIGSARAHATLDLREAPAGSYQKLAVRIGHGCEGTPTRVVRVRIPDGVTSVKLQPKPGWKAGVVREKLATPQTDTHGKSITEVVREAFWRGGKLDDDAFDEFAMQVKLPETPDTTLYFPVVQECDRGVHRWIQIPEAGKSGRELKEPAPALRLGAPQKH